jgi:hypothetical protein
MMDEDEHLRSFTSEPRCYELWEDYESSLKKEMWLQDPN